MTEVIDQIEIQVSAIELRANELVIQTDDDVQRAGSELQLFKALKKQIDETFDPIIKAARDATDAARQQKAKHWDPVKRAEDMYRDKSRLYLEAKAEQSRLEKEKIERQRREEEQARRKEDARIAKIESDTRAAEARALAKAASSNREKERLRKEAERIKRESAEEAELARQAPVIIEEAVVVEAPRVKGLSLVKRWKHRVVNVKLIPREYMKPDDVKIRQVARAMKENTNIPGVEVYSDTSTSVR